jgi:transposase InsO family protein
MAWREVNVSEQRLQFVIAASAVGSNVAGLCRAYGVSRQTGYTWLKRYQKGGAQAVIEEQSRRPHLMPRQTGSGMVEAIKQLRRDKPDWGARKLLPIVLSRHPELAKQRISTTTVHRILEREQLIAAQDRRKPAPQRFERNAPNELWQMDFKGPQGFNRRTGPLSIQDDYSRYLLALQHLGSTQLKGVQRTLRETFESCGLPEFLLIDHGTPWYNGWSAWGWTELTVWVLQQGVRVILSGVRHPQTQGKVERMHGALQRAIRKRKGGADQQPWLDEFRQEYNHVRPHEGIGMKVPAERWQASERCFESNRREWEYPAGWEVHRLGGAGQLGWQGKRWEVSGALRGQAVGLQCCGDRVLVHFCNLALREIDLRTGRNVTLPVNPFRNLQC